jgi:hypothetical protein
MKQIGVSEQLMSAMYILAMNLASLLGNIQETMMEILSVELTGRTWVPPILRGK